MSSLSMQRKELGAVVFLSSDSPMASIATTTTNNRRHTGLHTLKALVKLAKIRCTLLTVHCTHTQESCLISEYCEVHLTSRSRCIQNSHCQEMRTSRVRLNNGVISVTLERCIHLRIHIHMYICTYVHTYIHTYNFYTLYVPPFVSEHNQTLPGLRSMVSSSNRIRAALPVFLKTPSMFIPFSRM